MSELEPVWKAIDAIKHLIDDHSVRIKVCETKQEEFGYKHNDLCAQLKETDKKITTKLDLLLAEYHKSQGARGSAKWLPTIISSIVGLMGIYAFVSK